MLHQDLFNKVKYMNGLEGWDRFDLFKSKRDYILCDRKTEHTIWGLKDIEHALKSVEVK